MSTMNCLVGTQLDSRIKGKTTKFTRVEYWYGIETSTDDIDSVRFVLESSIYHVAIGSVSWCSQRRLQREEEVVIQEEPFAYDDSDDVDDDDSHGHRGLRVMALSSAPMDKLWSNITCPQTLLNVNDDCYVMQGLMTIMSHVDDDLSMSIDVIRDGIKNAMDGNALLTADVNHVSYLGTSVEDATSSSDDTTTSLPEPLSPFSSPTPEPFSSPTPEPFPPPTPEPFPPPTPGPVSPPTQSEPFSPPTVSGGINSVTSNAQGDDGTNSTNNYAPIMAVSFLGAGFVMIGLYLVGRRRRRRLATTTKKTKVDSSPPDDLAGGDETMIASIHEGDLHLTFENDAYAWYDDDCDGPTTELDYEAIAREAEMQYAFEKGLSTIHEGNEESFLDNDDRTLHSLVTASTSNLGAAHSTMDVQPCQSSFCKQCRPNDSGVVFIPRDWQPDMTPSNSDDDYESDSQDSENAII